MDRQRDDRLGWIQLHPRPLLQHRREILRAGRSLANTDSDGQPDSDGYSNADAHTYSYGHGNSDCGSDRFAYAVIHATSITYTKNSPDPEESAHAPAASVNVKVISDE